MNHIMRTVLSGCFVSIILVSTLLTGGCAKSADTEVVIQGWVYADGPVSDANLSVNNIDGKPIYESGDPVTGDNGSFLIAVNKLPADFKITASGGKIDGQDFASDLSAIYRNHDPNTVIHINIPTSFVAGYMAKNTAKTIAEATLTVKNYLLIPDWVDLGSDLQHTTPYFNHRLFSTEAAAHGGVTAYVNQLTTEMNNPALTHPFQPVSSNGLMGVTGAGVGGYIADKLAGGAISWAGGKFLGWTLDKIGIGFPDETDDRLNQLQSEMKNISKKLDELENQLNTISDKLSAEMQQVGYDIRTGQMGALISNINSIRAQLDCFASNPPADKNNLEKKRQGIIDQIAAHILGNENIIHDQLMGLYGQKSLIKVWAGIVVAKHPFLTADDYPDITAQFDYFDLLQQHLLELLVEYYHATSEDENYHPDCDRLMQDYATHLEAQKGILVQRVPDGVFVDTRPGGLMWIRHPAGNKAGNEYVSRVLDYMTGNYSPASFNNPTPFNQDPNCNLGFSDWILPSQADFNNLLKGYTGNNATVDWFVARGAFPADATLESTWANSGGGCWTSNYYWNGSKAREEIIWVNVGMNGGFEIVHFKSLDYFLQIGSLFPARVMTPTERYFW